MPPLPSLQLRHAMATTLAPSFEAVPQDAAWVLYIMEQCRTEVDILMKIKYPMANMSVCRPKDRGPWVHTMVGAPWPGL